MKTLAVFEPAMTFFDPALVQFAADLKWLEKYGVNTLRHNFGKEPEAFADSTAVVGKMEAGMNRLPMIVVEDQVVFTGKYPVQYQWTLIEGVNDSDAELGRIAQLLSGRYAIMNFIPFNTVDGLDYRRPSSERIASMVHTLRRHGILAKIRDSAGQEIEGACGQLRARAVKTK